MTATVTPPVTPSAAAEGAKTPATPASTTTTEVKTPPVAEKQAEAPKVAKFGEKPAEALPDEPVTEGDAGEASNAAEDKESKGEEKPISYDFGEAPEGLVYRDAVMDVAKKAFAEHKIDPAVAKALVDSVLPTINADFEKQIEDRIESMQQEFETELQTRHGEKLPQVRDLVNRTLHRFANENLIAKLADNRVFRALATDPDFHDMLAAIGERFTNDRPIKGGGPLVRRTMTPEQEMAAEYLKAEEAAKAKRGQ